ncbi:MAG: hypothetical protein AMXMBFR64_16980 [Myxococcales bacterium]
MVAGLREPDEVIATGADAGSPLRPATPTAGSQVRELATVRLGWRERRAELAARIAAHRTAPRLDLPEGIPPELRARLQRIDTLLSILAGEAEPGDQPLPAAPVEVSEVVPERPEVPARHDTVVMDAASIREAFSSDPEMAALVRRMEAEEERHDTILEMPAFGQEAPSRSSTEVELPAADISDVDTEEIEAVEEAELLVETDHARPPAPPDVATARTVPNQPAVEEEPFTSEWPREVELLYEDVHWLFQLGDIDGALISLERLLVLAPENEEIQAFVSLNERKLIEIYQSVLGDWDRVPRLSEGGLSMPVVTSTGDKVRRILKHIDGGRSIREILGASSSNRLEVCSVLSQLIRARVIVFDDQVVASRGA